MNHSNATQRWQSAHLNSRQTLHNRHVSMNANATLPLSGTPNLPTMVAPGCIPTPKQQFAPSRSLVFPHENEQPRDQPAHPNTMRSALHQAHLRSPTLLPTDLTCPRLYRYVAGFALPPRKINKALPVEIIDFDVSQELYDTLPSITPSDLPGAPGSRSHSEKTSTIRLRCVSGTDKALACESSWIEAENHWPDNLYLQCNSHMLEPRRRLHHNRDVPIDITAVVNPGRNRLTVVVNRVSTDDRPYEYALAVEIVGLVSHDAITKNLKQISATESLEAIKTALTASDSNDDEIVIITSNTIIKLFDPHTLTKIFDIPVRGAACRHRDCFDLETFLSLRDPKNKPGAPSIIDCWRCPICRGDVRPQTLIRDGFMDHVRDELTRKKILDIGHIVVDCDGSWRPREEEMSDVRSTVLDCEEGGSGVKASKVQASTRQILSSSNLRELRSSRDRGTYQYSYDAGKVNAAKNDRRCTEAGHIETHSADDISGAFPKSCSHKESRTNAVPATMDANIESPTPPKYHAKEHFEVLGRPFGCNVTGCFQRFNYDYQLQRHSQGHRKKSHAITACKKHSTTSDLRHHDRKDRNRGEPM